MGSANKSIKSTSIQDTDHDYAILGKLIVGIGEVAEMTGIPQRQLRYWQDKGIIKTVTEHGKASTRRFNYMEIKKILLIKELIDEGFTLDAASKKVEKRIVMIQETFRKLMK